MKKRRNYYKPYRRKRYRIRPGAFVLFIVIIAAIITTVLLVYLKTNDLGPFKPVIDPTPTQTPAPFVQSVPDPTPEPVTGIQPAATDSTQPSAFGFETDIQVDGQIVSDYTRAAPISFGSGADYTALKGVTTFRGNNYRTTSSYGAAEPTEETLTRMWNIDSGALTRWLGSGWTGQPLMVQWDDDMRQMMNMYDEKKEKDTLIEVIYPTMDGKVYFLDLDDGSYTRDSIDMGVSIKGTASVDPRGYPLLYVGQGVGASGDYEWDDTYMYIYSLLDGQLLWKYGAADHDEFAHRVSWQAYDSSPLIAADADTLVWPGENGVLYTVVLNSDFDRAAGTVNISASEPVKYRYDTPLNADDAEDVRWYGMENSAVAWKNYLYFTDNGGWLQCIDLNTMELVFAQDVNTDTDSSLVLEQEGDNVYLYTGGSVDIKHASGDDVAEGSCYIRKINALTGEFIWEKQYSCYKNAKVSGGVYATPLLGQGDMDGMIIYTIARTGSLEKGSIIAFDKVTGNVVWEQEMKHYSWSSPAAVYTPGGKGYIIQCDSSGDMMLLDGLTGETLDKVNLGENIEASPSVFNNMVVVGTKGEKIYGVRIN